MEIYTFFDFILNILYFVFSVLFFLVIFISLKDYKGKRIWSFLAKFLVTINLIYSTINFTNDIKYYFFEDYYLASQLEDFKKNLPLQVDFNTYLFDILKEDENINYFYKIENSQEVLSNKAKFQKRVSNSLCEDESSIDLLKKDYILNYYYYDEYNNLLFEIKTTKENCGESIYDIDLMKIIMKQQGL